MLSSAPCWQQLKRILSTACDLECDLEQGLPVLSLPHVSRLSSAEPFQPCWCGEPVSHSICTGSNPFPPGLLRPLSLTPVVAGAYRAPPGPASLLRALHWGQVGFLQVSRSQVISTQV